MESVKKGFCHGGGSLCDKPSGLKFHPIPGRRSLTGKDLSRDTSRLIALKELKKEELVFQRAKNSSIQHTQASLLRHPCPSLSPPSCPMSLWGHRLIASPSFRGEGVWTHARIPLLSVFRSRCPCYSRCPVN